MERRALSRFWATVAAVVVITEAASLPLAAPLSGATPVLITMSSSANPSVAGDPVALTFTFSRPVNVAIAPNDPARSRLRINLNYPGSPPPPSTSPLNNEFDIPNGSLGVSYDVYLQDTNRRPLVGTWHIWAFIFAWNEVDASTTAEIDQVVVPVPATPLVSVTASPTPAIAGARVRLTATLSSSASGPPPNSGSVAFTEAGQILGVAPVAAQFTGSVGKATTTVGPLSVGDHSIVAIYADPDGVQVSTSNPLLVQVIADASVAARSVGTSPATFYPVKDAYLDTLAIKGTLDEQASVSVSIYSVATGRKVRAFSLTPRSGAYQVPWNGRTSSGTLLAAGKYKVTQVLRDTLGNTKTVTSYATLSQRRMYWYTKSQTRFGDGFDDLGYCCGATVSTSRSRFSRGVLIAGYGDYAWPFVTYQFTVPAATVYRNIRFQALGVDRSTSGDSGLVALWNWRLNDSGDQATCPTSYSWCSTKSVSGADWVKSRAVSADVIAQHGGAYDVERVKLTYTYGILE
jgi:hypothetical protein